MKFVPNKKKVLISIGVSFVWWIIISIYYLNVSMISSCLVKAGCVSFSIIAVPCSCFSLTGLFVELLVIFVPGIITYFIMSLRGKN